MKVLLLGGTGQVGSEIRDICHREGITCIAPSSAEMDITNKTSVDTVIEKNILLDFIINASAYTAVDKAEDDVELAYKINRDGPRYLAEACSCHTIPLIHISTDYVFDGRASTPYKEDDPTAALGVYGQSKLEGEQAIRSSITEHIILRTAWVYGANGNNFVKTMLKLGRQHPELKVVNDQMGCPTAAADIAQTVIAMIQQLATQTKERWGTYHYCSANSTHWADFAKAIFEQAKTIDANYPCVSVLPISSNEYPSKAARPGYSVLDCSKIEHSFAVTSPIWQKSLKHVISNILKYMQ